MNLATLCGCSRTMDASDNDIFEKDKRSACRPPQVI